MKFTHLLTAIGCAMSMICNGEEKQTDIFDYSAPVDLSVILQTYDWYQHYDNVDKDSILDAKLKLEFELPKDEFYLFEDTTFVLRVTEYAKSKQPFLANAEDFYNCCALLWNVWSNYEVWFRGHTADLLRDDDEIKKNTNAISANIIKNKDVCKAAQAFKESILKLMETEPEKWNEDFNPMELLISYNNVIESKAYKFYDDEETFVGSINRVINIAEGMAMDKFQNYLDANEDDQVKIMLNEIATCHNYDEQCSLWRNWANCEKSNIDDRWILAVGHVLMLSGNYNPILQRIWITWRAICQEHYFGCSKDSSIPNQYYNEYRKICYISCLKRIENHPDDIYAMNCAAAIGGRTNINRFGQFSYGNEAIIEQVMMMPNRYYAKDNSSDEFTE